MDGLRSMSCRINTSASPRLLQQPVPRACGSLRSQRWGQTLDGHVAPFGSTRRNRGRCLGLSAARCAAPDRRPETPERAGATPSVQRGLTALTKPPPGVGAIRSALLPLTPRAKGAGSGPPAYRHIGESSLTLPLSSNDHLATASDWLTRDNEEDGDDDDEDDGRTGGANGRCWQSVRGRLGS